MRLPHLTEPASGQLSGSNGSSAAPFPADGSQQTAEQFCESRGVIKEFETVRRLAEASFGATALNFSRDVDAETGESGITIRVAAKGKTAEAALESYHRLIDALMREIPSDTRGLFSVTLDFSR